MAGAPIPDCPGWYSSLFRCCLCLFECHVFEEELAAFSPGAFCLTLAVVDHDLRSIVLPQRTHMSLT